MAEKTANDKGNERHSDTSEEAAMYSTLNRPKIIMVESAEHHNNNHTNNDDRNTNNGKSDKNGNSHNRLLPRRSSPALKKTEGDKRLNLSGT